MSVHNQVELECPYCHRKQLTTVWESINVQISPEAKKELIEGNINVFHCQKCDKKVNITTKLLYHDMGKQFLVLYFPFEWLKSEDVLESFTRDGNAWSGRPNLQLGYISQPPHVVFDMNELVRYVFFREKLFEYSQAKQS
jgi:hypothetical protein